MQVNLSRACFVGVFLEQLECEPSRFLPEIAEDADALSSAEVVNVDLNQPMADVLALLDAHPIKTRLRLTGTLVVARDIAHAKLQVMQAISYGDS